MGIMRQTGLLLTLLLIVSIARAAMKLYGMWKMTHMPFMGHLIVVSNLGIMLHFAIGPLFYLYVKSRIDSKYKLEAKELLHFVVFFIFFVLFFFYEASFWDLGTLRFHYIHLAAYYLIALRLYLLRIHSGSSVVIDLRGLKITFFVSAVLMLIYAPILYAYVDYIDATLIYGSSLFLVYLLITHKGQLRTITKYRRSTLSADKAKQLRVSLDALMQNEKLYLNSDLSLHGLAEKLKVSINHLSQCINAEFGKSFNDYINSLRVETVKQKLKDKENEQYKIAYLAFNSGFESISSFNTAFKKFTGMTPRQFKES